MRDSWGMKRLGDERVANGEMKKLIGGMEIKWNYMNIFYRTGRRISRRNQENQFCCETCNKEAEKKIKGRCVGGGEGEKMVELNSEVEEIIRR